METSWRGVLLGEIAQLGQPEVLRWMYSIGCKLCRQLPILI